MSKPWSEWEVTTLKHLMGEGFNSSEIAERMIRTVKSVRTRIARLRLTPEARAQRAEYERNRQRGRKRYYAANGTMPKIPTPLHVLADRDARYRIKPRSITAILCGDPLPGYSALERRT